MGEKKVATKQERLMFEKLIQTDRQYPNRRQNEMTGGNEMMMQRNTPQAQRNNLEQHQAQPNETYQPQQSNPALQIKRPTIKRNIGKREAVWEEKRKRKIEMVEFLNQRLKQYDDRQQYPLDQYRNEYESKTPSEAQRTPVNRAGIHQEERQTPMANQMYTQQQRNTPMDQKYNHQPQQTRTPITNYGYEQRPERTPIQNQERRTPINQDYYQQQNRTPMQNNQTMPNQQIRKTPNNNENNNRQNNITQNNMQITMEQPNMNNSTPLNTNQDISQRNYSNQNIAQRGTPHYGGNQPTPNNQPQQNRTPNNQQQSRILYNQPPVNGTPYNQPQQTRTPQYENQPNPYNQPPANRTPYNQPPVNGTPYNQPPINRTPYNQPQPTYQPTPSKNNHMGYDQRSPQYCDQENYNRSNQQYSKTPQQYGGHENNYQRTPQYRNEQMPQQQMRGSRTPFTDSLGNQAYKPSGSFYNQHNNPNTMSIPNRPPSRPFDNLSFKDQQIGNSRGLNQNYYPNSQQPYY